MSYSFRWQKQSASANKRTSSDGKLYVATNVEHRLSYFTETCSLYQEAKQQQEQQAADEKAQAARVLAEEQRQAQEKMHQMQQQQLAQLKQLQQIQLMQKVGSHGNQSLTWLHRIDPICVHILNCRKLLLSSTHLGPGRRMLVLQVVPTRVKAIRG